jgi:hypothetical protein
VSITLQIIIVVIRQWTNKTRELKCLFFSNWKNSKCPIYNSFGFPRKIQVQDSEKILQKNFILRKCVDSEWFITFYIGMVVENRFDVTSIIRGHHPAFWMKFQFVDGPYMGVYCKTSWFVNINWPRQHRFTEETLESCKYLSTDVWLSNSLILINKPLLVR